MAKIKKQDTVMVIAGKDKGKTGVVTAVMPKEERVLVEGVNIVKRHVRGQSGQAGEIVEREAPIHISNVMLLDPKSKAPTRVGFAVNDGSKTRVAKKSGTTLK